MATIDDDLRKHRINYHDEQQYLYEFEACIDCNCPTEMACMMMISTDRCPKMRGWRDEQRRRDEMERR